MSRSDHHGCGRGGGCGLCRPEKKWRGNAFENQKPSVRRTLQENPLDDVDLMSIQRELSADPAYCTKDCCRPLSTEQRLLAAETEPSYYLVDLML